jgi:KDO2-lipid IV(A) lauroyltransferase
VVKGAQTSVLDDVTRRVFVHVVLNYYDFLRAVEGPRDRLTDLVTVPRPFSERIEAELGQGRGVLLLGPHVGAFDLGMLALRARGWALQVLTLAEPSAGSQFWNRLRAHGDLEVTPVTSESLRVAVRRLREGAVVVTGAERPVPGESHMTEFFGQPAPLPVGAVRMALMTKASVYVASCPYDPDRGYVLGFSGPVELMRTGDRRDIAVNVRRVATVLEEHIRAHPEQWFMFHPVWPQSPRD